MKDAQEHINGMIEILNVVEMSVLQIYLAEDNTKFGPALVQYFEEVRRALHAKRESMQETIDITADGELIN